MNEEDLKAIEGLKKIREETRIANECGLSTNDFKEDLEIYDAILNLIENSISKEKIRKIHENTDNRYDFMEEILKLIGE